ncbi:MAG: hypothetical protein Q4D38_12870 [Planctomycetia bacterium]|nr:hypothetical protein [Planctomycetia bacterium]
MRALRRQLRAWRDDFLKFWGRLTTFHRTALGILIAIGLVYVGRVQWIDPMNVKIAEAEEALKESAPPDPIPTIETDDEVQEAIAKIEGREGMRDKRKQEMEAVADSRPKVTASNKDSVWAEFALLVSQNKLRLVLSEPLSAAAPPPAAAPARRTRSSKAKTKAKEDEKTAEDTSVANSASPFPMEKYQFHLEGTFENIMKFLETASKYPYPSKIENVQLGTYLVEESKEGKKDAKTGAKTSAPVYVPTPGEPPRLQLKFVFTLYIQEGK